MQVGLIGLGKMGFNLGLNLMKHTHTVNAFDVNEQAVTNFKEQGGQGFTSMQEVVEALPTPRIVWLMVPSGDITKSTVAEITQYLEAGDILIDGGNSHYKESIAFAQQLKEEKGIHFMDIGTSGGTEGALNGACMMVGGDKEAFNHIEPFIKEICVEHGYVYAGEAGSGHFLKMIHNGIEYGMMQSIAEGFEVLEKSPYDFDYEQVAQVWNNGSVIRSWLMELTQNAFSKDSKLEGIRGVMNSSGEGKWTVETALELEAPVPVTTLALMMRYRSQEDDTFTGKVVAALRNEFGGHAVVKK
ncbi:phosphogluconate dehydrogenase (NAD(+)-dependent, decarboxylating) [Kurthia sibirica]|uniref:Decarboxylating 6-phosphogluconate dehydrogenase n=1 Tax=Kurthia sibirica TaxID=202750 RepID=A0A2U3AJI5_9BACL|nr:decarboxylating 6-phosphogluconate dehydrogenase [Kurthia sibirica]PWI24698.1 decarboxylating 6-phosphogluconate dehydrogenase [Kurthia sibirica]GEK34540.1 6-phosphogluconate dehydrogenase (decarboxylating) [Kurthia sibirica]